MREARWFASSIPPRRRSRKHCREPGSFNRAVRLFHESGRAQCLGRLGFIEVAGRRQACRARLWTQLSKPFFDFPETLLDRTIPAGVVAAGDDRLKIPSQSRNLFQEIRNISPSSRCYPIVSPFIGSRSPRPTRCFVYAASDPVIFRDECLNANWFLSLANTRTQLECWRTDYNRVRPHSAPVSNAE